MFMTYSGMRNFMKLILGVFFLFMCSCQSRFAGNHCKPPNEYRNKSVASIMKEAKEIVSNYPGKKAIAFCVYGSRKPYTYGLLENIDRAKEMYPGWDVVAFLDPETVPPEIIREAKAKGARVILSPKYKNAAVRFFVADLNYDIFISRDSDSRIYPREVAAVADWLKHDWAIIHNMRDSKNSVNPMLAGMWGARVKPLREKLHAAWKNDNVEKLYEEYMGDRKAKYGDDELFLKDKVLKAVGEDNFLDHESFRCDEFKNSRGFPIPRGNSGVHIGGIRPFD